MTDHHFVLLSFPAQGHLNPNLQLSKRLLRLGVRVTFITSSYARLGLTPIEALPDGLTFVECDDGYDGVFRRGEEGVRMMNRMEMRSSEALRRVVSSAAEEGRPVTCVAYSLLLPWVARVARELHVLSAFVWIQAATMFDVYYWFYHGFESVLLGLDNGEDNPGTVDLPGLPLAFGRRDLPSFTPSSTSSTDMFYHHIAGLDSESNPAIVLINSFDALEPEALKSISKMKLIAVGPLIPSAFLDAEDPTDIEFGGDLFQNTSNSYVEWLDSKPDSSVVYVSFGSISIISKQQLEEIGKGLLELGKPFLWVIRESGNESEKLISCMEELEKLGLIVPWCSQLRVLSHRAVSCFFTHCGWNSTIEGLANGVPMVGFPQLFDQFTNAKLIEDCFKIGARVNANGEGLVKMDEIKRRLELVMGDSKMRQNAVNWKKLAVEAVKEGGSSDKNLRDFVNHVA